MTVGDLNFVTVSGTIEGMDGSFPNGTITFTPSIPDVLDATSSLIILSKPFTATVTTGVFSVSLPATDDPDVTPIGWNYTVAFNLGAGSPGQAQITVPIAYVSSGVTLATLLGTSVIGTPSSNYLIMPTGAPSVGEYASVTSTTPLTLSWVASPLVAAEAYTDASVAGLQAQLNFTYTGLWVTATAYSEGNFTLAEGAIQYCTANHTSGTFDTDKTAGLWITTGIDPSSAEVVPVGGLGTTPTAVKTGAYNAVLGDLVFCDTTGGAFTVTLPTAPADKSVVDVYLENGTTTLTVAVGGGSDVFGKPGGATTSTLTTASQKKRYTYCSALAVWIVYDFFSLTGINALIAAGSGGAVAGAHGSLTSPVSTSGTGDTAMFTSTAWGTNTLVVGSTIKIRCGGVASATGTLQFKVHLGTTGTISDTVVATSKITAAMAATQWADVDAIVTVRTNGSSGTCIGSFLGVSGPSLIPNSTTAASTSAVDTTTTNYLTISCATSNGTFTAEVAYAEQAI